MVIFDVLGTLFSLTPVGEFVHSLLTRELTHLNASPTLISSLPSPPTLTFLLYAEVIKEAVSLSYAQFYTPIAQLFPPIIQRIINRHLYHHTPHHHTFTLSPSDQSNLSSTLTSLPPRPTASAALTTLSQYATLIALSNGSLSSTTSLLSHASLLPLFSSSALLSADTAKATKPDANVYAQVTPHVKGDTPVYFVSQHSFDAHGVLRWNALREGGGKGQKGVGEGEEEGRAWVTVWVSEEEREWLDVGEGVGGAKGQPDIIAKDLTDAAEKIGQHVAQLRAETKEAKGEAK